MVVEKKGAVAKTVFLDSYNLSSFRYQSWLKPLICQWRKRGSSLICTTRAATTM